MRRKSPTSTGISTFVQRSRSRNAGAKAGHEIHIVDPVEQFPQIGRLIGIVERGVEKQRMLSFFQRRAQRGADAQRLRVAQQHDFRIPGGLGLGASLGLGVFRLAALLHDLAKLKAAGVQFVSKGVVTVSGNTLGPDKTLIVRDPDGHASQLTETSLPATASTNR